MKSFGLVLTLGVLVRIRSKPGLSLAIFLVASALEPAR